MAKKKEPPVNKYGEELEQVWDDGPRISTYIKKNYKKELMKDIVRIHESFDKDDPMRVKDDAFKNAEDIFKYMKNITLPRTKEPPQVYLFITNGCALLFLNDEGEQIEDEEIISPKFNIIQDWLAYNLHEATEKFATKEAVLYTLLRTISEYGNTVEEINLEATKNILSLSMEYITTGGEDEDKEEEFDIAF